MIPSEVVHTEKIVRRTADGRIAELQEHSWKEPASEHAKHSSAAAEALAAQERVIERKTNLRTQVAEFRGRLTEVQELLALSTEAFHREQGIRADVEAKLLGRERQVRSLLAREKALVAETQAASRKSIQSPVTPVTLVAPRELDQLAVDYLADLADLEQQLAETGRSTPIHWVLAPGTVASEAAS